MKRARPLADYTHRILPQRGAAIHALRRIDRPHRGLSLGPGWITACEWPFSGRAIGPTWLDPAEPVTCKRCLASLARASAQVAQAALGDLMIGEQVLVSTRQDMVTGRVAEVGDHSIWLYDHDSENTDHDRQWRALRRSVTGLERLAPPVGWTREEVAAAMRLP